MVVVFYHVLTGEKGGGGECELYGFSKYGIGIVEEGDVKYSLYYVFYKIEIFMDISNNTYDKTEVIFTIITNRPIADNFKQNISKIANGNVAEPQFQKTIKKYTNLDDNNLKIFCASLELYDAEGDYNAQRYELHKEISHIVAGSVDNAQIDSIIEL